jgi:Gpi18-like mannosyltransferase
MRVLGQLIHRNFIAGLIISNTALFFAARFLYRLVKLEHTDEDALRAIKYLFLFPSAFMLSCVLSESLYLCLVLICFYSARKQRWFAAGAFGFFAALTRPQGILLLLPLIYEYLKSSGFRISKIKPGILFLLFVPMGLAIFLTHCYFQMGDFFAYYHAKKGGWGMFPTNPLHSLWVGFLSRDINVTFSFYITLALFILLIFSLKSIRFSYWLFAFVSILVPLSSLGTHMSVFIALLRFLLPVFPLYIIFARISRYSIPDQFLTIVMTMLQALLMFSWSNHLYLVS